VPADDSRVLPQVSQAILVGVTHKEREGTVHDLWQPEEHHHEEGRNDLLPEGEALWRGLLTLDRV